MLLRDIIGQDAIKRELCRGVQQGRIAHALLLSGPAGVGKLPLALAYAQYIACKHRTDNDACGVCPTCLQYSKLQHPDLHFVFPIVKTDSADVCDNYLGAFREMVLANPYSDADDWLQQMGGEKKQSMIYEKESGEIQRKLSLKAFGDGYKVMIVWQPEKMHIACANKLLKLLEEPPEKTVFILVSEHPEQLLQTIRSRVQEIPLPPLKEEEIAEDLIHNHGLLEAPARRIAHTAQGSLSNALRLITDDDDNKQFFDLFVQLMRLSYVRKVKEMKLWSEEVASLGRERQKKFLSYCQHMIRENFMYNFHQSKLNYMSEAESDFAVKFAPFINENNVIGIMNELSLCERDIAQNANPKIVFFDFSLKMIVLIKNR